MAAMWRLVGLLVAVALLFGIGVPACGEDGVGDGHVVMRVTGRVVNGTDPVAICATERPASGGGDDRGDDV